MKRSIAAALALVLVCSAFMMCVPQTASASGGSLYIRKIVSVVYDDSGSMGNNGCVNWAYANYAMQAFCGLLNSDDQLYITYMSEVEKAEERGGEHVPPKVDLSESAIQSSVNSIRDHSGVYDTPYSAIDVAFKKLQSVEDTDANTQYWFFVITDGYFQTGSNLDTAVNEDQLNDKLEACAGEKMANGSTPRVTYLAIGNNALVPKKDLEKGIYVYESAGASAIVETMSKIADQVSGRSRLSESDIVLKDSNTIEITSEVPLLNIAVLSQRTGAKITGASYSNGKQLNVSRSVSLSYPEQSSRGWTTDKSLNGTAFLINNRSDHIEAGTYTIQFSESVSLENIVVMFEPALEMRMQILLNGKEVELEDLSDLAAEGDTLTISCKVYEMGTDRVVDPDRLPAGTQFEISVSEDGVEKKTAKGEDMLLSDYELKQVETELKASLTIPGFNPIESSYTLSPAPPRIKYTIAAEYGGSARSVKYDDIASNEELSLVFTVYADGEAMTDPAAVRALNPVISLSPQGNDGYFIYTDDGKIVFIPTAASTPEAGAESFDVDVTCSLEDGTSEQISYTVLIADYEIFVIDAAGSVKKTEFFGNEVGVSFYITKDGVKLDKAAVEKGITVLLNEEHQDLLTKIAVSPDGTITVTPYSDEEYRLNFWRWWINWAHYFRLEGEDVTVSLLHMYGSASATIDVQGESVQYLLLNVYLPLLIEAALLLFLLWWAYAIWAKPKFLPNAVLYVAGLYFSNSNKKRHHEISNFTVYSLKKYNSLKYRLGLTTKPKQIPIAPGIRVAAGSGGSIVMYCPVWYSGGIKPKAGVPTDHPDSLRQYINQTGMVSIKELSPMDRDGVEMIVTLSGPDHETYYVSTDAANIRPVGGIETIDGGHIFAYAYRPEL